MTPRQRLGLLLDEADTAANQTWDMGQQSLVRSRLSRVRTRFEDWTSGPCWALDPASGGTSSAGSLGSVALACPEYFADLAHELRRLAAALRPEHPDLAETIVAAADQRDTAAEAPGDVLPSVGNLEVPGWLKLAAGLVIARELVRLVGAVR